MASAPLITKLELLQDTLATAPENYKDNVRIISGLDDKAQKMGTIAGVFLGVLLALVKPDQLSTLLGAVGRVGIWVVTLVIILLMACIGFCLWTMWTKKIPPPLSLGHMAQITKHIHKGADLDQDTQRVYVNERIQIWRSCIDAQATVAAAKQKRVFWAQLLLAAAMILVACALLYLIHSVHPTPPTIQPAAPAAATK
jgi:hypothetical protein